MRGRFLIVCSALGLGAGTLPAQSDLMSYQAYATVGTAGPVRDVAFHPNGDIIAVGGDAQIVTLYDLPGRRQNSLAVPRGRVRSLAFSRDGALLAAGTDAGVVHVWDVRTSAARTFDGLRGDVASVAFSPNGDMLAAGSDKEVALWSVTTGQSLGRLRGAHKRAIVLVGFVGRGDQLVTVGEDRQIVTWDVRTQSPVRQTQEADATIKSAAMSPGGDWLVIGTETTQLPGARGGNGVNRMGLVYEDRIKFYDLQTGLVAKTVNNLIVDPASVALSADYKYVAVSQRDTRLSSIGIYDVDRGVRIGDIPSPTNATRVAFAPSGKWLAYGDERGQLFTFEVKGVFPRGATVADLAGRKYSLTSSSEPLVRPSRRVRFAILDLDNLGVEEYVAKLIADQLTNRLAQNPFVRLVERRRLEQVVKEQNLQHSGRTDPATATRLARILNVQKVVLGSVGKLGTTMTIYTQLVDVETGAIEGAREMQCRNCSLEDLPQAVSEMSSSLVAPAAPGTPPLPSPPRIEIDSPSDNAQVRGQAVMLHGRVSYGSDLEGVELVVNGQTYPASRIFAAPTAGRMTRLDGGTSFEFVQQVPLTERANLIAVRAVSADGNDEQQYVNVERLTEEPTPAAPVANGASPAPNVRPAGDSAAARRAATARASAPGISLSELEDALRHAVPAEQLNKLIDEFGLAFKLGPAEEQRLKARGASSALLLKLAAASAKR